jgi:hypothetical protein
MSATESVSGAQQSRASAGRDLAGRDINNITTTYNSAPRAAGVIEQLLEKLHSEIGQNAHAREVVEKLQRYHKKKTHDGVVGLQEKLTKAGRSDSYFDAIEMKEMFAKLLDEWSLYASAQQIFIFLLARAERQFNDVIFPQVPILDAVRINQLTSELIVEPAVLECGASVFQLDHNTALGMVYWLAEQCFVRWHK